MTPLTGCHGGAPALSSPSLCVSSDSLRLNQSYIMSFIKLSTPSPSRLSYDPSYHEAVHAAYKMLCHRYTDARLEITSNHTILMPPVSTL